MGILDRMSNILRANINELLDRAEDPEKMLNQITRDMESSLQEAKTQVTETIAQEKLLKSNLDRARELASQWQKKAELAVDKGQDDLARECLRRKKDFEANAAVYEPQLATQQQMVEKIKADLAVLEAKYEEIKRNREMLIARHKAAEAQKKIQGSLAGIGSVDYSSEFGRMEEKIRMEEARAAASAEINGASLDARLDALSISENDSALDDELQAIKAKRNKTE